MLCLLDSMYAKLKVWSLLKGFTSSQDQQCVYCWHSSRLCRIGLFLNGVWREVPSITIWNTAEDTGMDASLCDANNQNLQKTQSILVQTDKRRNVAVYVTFLRETDSLPLPAEALMLTVCIQLKERRKSSGAMLVDKVKLMASVLFDGVLALYSRFFPLLAFSASPQAPTTKQKVNFTFDLATYFLFLVRGLASYQDEGKCQDGGSADTGPAGCQVRRLPVKWELKTKNQMDFIYIFI